MTDASTVAASSEVDLRHRWEDRLARPMFAVAFLFLIILAGLLHRYPRLGLTDDHLWSVLFEPLATLEQSLDASEIGVLELLAICWGLFATWVLIGAEQVFRLVLGGRDGRQPGAMASALVVLLIPPLRMGQPGQFRPGRQIWLPWLGWQAIDKDLRRRLERYFSVPMIVIALHTLPFLAIEYGWAAQVQENPWLALVLHIGISIIWLAFAVEFIVMVSIAESKWRYCLLNWVSLAIVLLPLIEVLPVMRVLRLGRVLRIDYIARMSRLYRLQGLAMRAWRALLVLEIVQLVIGSSVERRLKQLEQLLAAKEEEVANLRKEIAELRERIAREKNPPGVPDRSEPAADSPPCEPEVSTEGVHS